MSTPPDHETHRAALVRKGQCGNCGSKLQVKTHSDEKVVDCPKCHSQATISAAGAPEAALAPHSPEVGPKPYAFPCPNCGNEIEARRSSIGKAATCPECEQKIRVPEPHGRPRGAGEPDDDGAEAGLTLGDWFVCIFLSPVGFIAGFIRLVQGKATGGAMIGYSMLSMFLGLVLILVLAMLAMLAMLASR